MATSRRLRAVQRAIQGISALAGLIVMSAGINYLTGSDKGLGWILLLIGAAICSGGILPLLYGLYCDLRAKLIIEIQDTWLTMEEQQPGVSRWCFTVEFVVVPPRGHEITFESDGLRATLENSASPLEIAYMGIGPASNPDAMSGELTVAQRRRVICEGVTCLNIDPDIPVNPPETFPFCFTVTDITGDWTATIRSRVVQSGKHQWRRTSQSQAIQIIAGDGTPIKVARAHRHSG